MGSGAFATILIVGIVLWVTGTGGQFSFAIMVVGAIGLAITTMMGKR